MIQSLARGLQILEHVSRSDEGATAADIGALLTVKSTTAFNLAKTLVRLGYLSRTTSRPVRYHLGPAAYELIARRESGDLSNRAEAVVRSLVAEFPEATVLFVQAIGHEIMIRLRMDHSRQGVLQRPLNRSVSPYGTAVSTCYQAFWSVSERESFQRHHPFEEYAGEIWTNRAHFNAELKAIRERGYCILTTRKPLIVAVPIYTAGGVLAGTLGISLPEDFVVSPALKEQVIRQVRKAGELLSNGGNRG